MSIPANASPCPANPWAGSVSSHYENFPVGSWLLPAAIRPAVAALYRFARYADDVADEGDALPGQRLEELERLRLAVLLPGRHDHPAVSPLRPWIDRFDLDTGQLTALLSAFSQDVTTVRYDTPAGVLDYCSRSANPVGRLMLQLFGVTDSQSFAHSDAICSALQLINFVQDVGVDWRKQRIYLPLQTLAVHGCTPEQLAESVQRGQASPALRLAIADCADRAGRLLESGRPLTGRVPWRLGLELRAIMAGGRQILERLATARFDPIAARPALKAADLPAILVKMF